MSNDDANRQTQLAADLLRLEAQPCPKCGLLVPSSLDSCPNDGTVLREFSADSAILDRYELLSPIGEGGMSVVFKARHLLIGNFVAIKMLQSRLGTRAFKRFQQEAKAVSMLRHPHITVVHDFGLLPNGSAFLVMDYEAGENLAEHIKLHGPLTVEHCLPLFIQLADALEHAHNNKVLHRDLKPSNVMISGVAGRLSAKLVDFGIAKVIDADSDAPSQPQLTGTGEVCGSPAYMSPEQCHGIPIDQRSDLYSLGCLMYEALSGKPPHQGENAIEVLYKHMNENAAPLVVASADKRLGQGLQHIQDKLLKRDRDSRYASAEDLKSDLLALQSGATLRLARKSPSPVVLAIAGVALCAMGAAIMLWNPAPKAVVAPEQPTAPMPTSAAPGRKTGITAGYSRVDDTSTDKFEAKDLGRHRQQLFDDAEARRILAGSTRFTVIDLSKTRITDKTLEMLKSNTKLTKLVLDHTNITDEGLKHLSAFPELDTLSLMNLPLTDAGMKHVGRLNSLVTLHINRTLVGDAGVAEIAKLPNLKMLGASYTQITDKGLVDLLSKQRSLDRIGCGTHFVSDRTLEQMPSMPSLRWLQLPDSNVTDKGIPLIIAKCQFLKGLKLSGSAVTYQGLAQLKTLPGLTDLLIDGCPNVSQQDVLALKKLMPALYFKERKITD